MVSVGAVSAANTGSAAEARQHQCQQRSGQAVQQPGAAAADSFVRMGVVFILHLL